MSLSLIHIYGAHSIVLWELHGKPCHLGPQCGQRHLARQKLLRRSGNEQLGVVILRQRGEMAAASSVEIQCFLCAEMVALADVYKRQGNCCAGFWADGCVPK